MLKKVKQAKLFNIAAKFGTNPPGFALLLGSGASATSGVKTGGQMVEEWREESFVQNHKDKEKKRDYLERQPSYKKHNEYGKLFEAIYDLPAQRRKYIESCLSKCYPSWGYTYLASFIANGYFNVIITTNFDDLVNDVCYKFPSVPKPLLCAHDSNINSVRLLSSHPIIVKLHGDFLFDDIKNTTQETTNLEKNMQDKVAQFASEYGLIVVGYGGRDASVMDTLKNLIRDENNFKNGIYWCVSNNDISDRLEDLAENERVHLVDIEGFDEFMAEFNNHLGLALPRELAAPYESLGESIDQLLSEAVDPDRKLVHPVILKHQGEIRKALQKLPPKIVPKEFDFEKISGFDFRVGPITVRQQIPYGPIGEAHEEAGNTEHALKFLKLQIKHGPNPRAFTYVFKLLSKHGLVDERYGEFKAMLKAKESIFKVEYGAANDLAITLMNLCKWSDAKWVLDEAERALQESGDNNPILECYFKINRMQIKSHQNKVLTKQDHRELEKILTIDNPYTKLGAATLLHKWQIAESALETCILHEVPGKSGINTWPIIKLLKPHLKRKAIKEKLRKLK